MSSRIEDPGPRPVIFDDGNLVANALLLPATLVERLGRRDLPMRPFLIPDLRIPRLDVVVIRP